MSRRGHLYSGLFVALVEVIDEMSAAIMKEMAYAQGIHKVCSRCKENKSIDEFGKNRSEKDGLSSYCRECKSIAGRASWAKNANHKNAKRRIERKTNPDKIRQLDQERYERDKERILERMASYYRANPEPKKIRAKARYWENPERAKAETIAWRRENLPRARETGRIKQQRRRARKLNQFIEDVDPRIVYQMHGGMCGICEQFVPEDNFHVDHVIPLAKGGMHGYINVQPAHPLCNWSKRDKVMISNAK